MSRAAPGRLAGLIVLLVACSCLLVPAAHAQGPKVSAPQAILIEQATGDVVYGKKETAERPIASTTKLMTALLALERLSLEDVLVQVPYAGAPAESIGGFRGGERVTVRDELRALLLASANDAANTLAIRISGTRAKFVRDMNARAKALGLTNTSYSNPVGLDDPKNYSSAADLVKLALVLRQNAFFRETTNLRRVTIRSGAMPRSYANRNQLVRTVGYVNGVKTGRTSSAGYVLVGSATRDGVTVLSAVLGTSSEAARNADTLALLRYGLNRYSRRTIVKKAERFGSAALAYREESVALVASRGLVRTARKGEKLSVRATGAPAELNGPLPQGARVGTIVVRQRGKVVDRIPLVTRAAVTEASATDRLGEFVGRTRTLLLLTVFLLGSLLLVVLRRRSTKAKAKAKARADRSPRAGTTEIA